MTVRKVHGVKTLKYFYILPPFMKFPFDLLESTIVLKTCIELYLSKAYINNYGIIDRDRSGLF